MPPRYVKPYVKRNKNDAADAEAICEAVTRPTMRFVAVKSAEQQSVLMLHRTRELLVRQRTMLVNAIRAQMAELGVVVRAVGGACRLTPRFSLAPECHVNTFSLELAPHLLAGLHTAFLGGELLLDNLRWHAHGHARGGKAEFEDE